MVQQLWGDGLAIESCPNARKLDSGAGIVESTGDLSPIPRSCGRSFHRSIKACERGSTTLFDPCLLEGV